MGSTVEFIVAGVDMSDVVDSIEFDERDDEDEYLRCESGGVRRICELWVADAADDVDVDEADELR